MEEKKLSNQSPKNSLIENNFLILKTKKVSKTDSLFLFWLGFKYITIITIQWWVDIVKGRQLNPRQLRRDRSMSRSFRIFSLPLLVLALTQENKEG